MKDSFKDILGMFMIGAGIVNALNGLVIFGSAWAAFTNEVATDEET